MRSWIFATLLLIAGPAASAAADRPVDAALAFHDSVDLNGRLIASASEGLLDLGVGSVEAPGAIHATITWERAVGVLATDRKAVITTPLREQRVPLGVEKEEMVLGPGSLEDIDCSGHCVVLLAADAGRGANIALEGDAAGTLAWLLEEHHYYLTPPEMTGQGEERRFPAGWIHLGESQFEPLLALQEMRAAAEGDLVFSLWGATATLAADGGGRVRTGEYRTNTSNGPEDHVVYLMLRLEGARVSAGPDVPARFVAPSPAIEIEGTISSALAQGTIRVDGRTTEVRNEPLALDGRFSFDPVGQRAPEGGSTTLRIDPFRATVGGDAQEIRVNGIAIARDPPAGASAEAVATISAAALLLGALLWILRAPIAALYTRIGRAEALDNENRQRIFADLRANPAGRTLQEIADATGTIRAVVRHHIRVLAGHGFIAERLVAGRRLYFVHEHLAVRDATLQARLVLRGQARLSVASRLAAVASGLTQQDLVQTTGLSQRLVSYHLAKLASAGLVDAEDATPKRYQATQALRAELSSETSTEAASG